MERHVFPATMNRSTKYTKRRFWWFRVISRIIPLVAETRHETKLRTLLTWFAIGCNFCPVLT